MWWFLWIVAGVLTAFVAAQPPPGETPACVPIAQRTLPEGCWIINDVPVGVLPRPSVYWYLDTFATRAAAEAVKPAGGAVVESLGRVWLMTIGEASGRRAGGDRVAAIGPIRVKRGVAYSAMYMEAIFTPGMESNTHTHSGPEAWYTLDGETCLETPNGVMVGRAGGPPVIVPEGPPMHLTATGRVTRRAVVLILHDRTQAATTITHAWTPKGLCRPR